MSKRLVYSSSAVETKDIEMVARELKLIYDTFVYAMTQLEVKANIYSQSFAKYDFVIKSAYSKFGIPI